MSAVKIIQVKNRLGEKLRKPGGQTVAQSLDAADTALAELKGPTFARVDELIVELDGLARAQDDASLERVYQVGCAVLDLAGMFEDRVLCAAASSLCDLADLLRPAGVADWASVAVHVRALQLIRQANGQGVEAVLDGLRQVVARAGRG